MNEENPYRFVPADPVGGSDDTITTFRQPTSGRKLNAKDVRRLAISQRALMICTAGFAPYAMLLATVGRPRVQDLIHLPTWALYALMVGVTIIGCLGALAFIVGLFFVFAVGRRTHPTWLALLFTLFAFLPPFCLPIYLYLHFRANYVLKRHGVSVKWAGAKFSSLPRADALPIMESSPA